MKTPLLTALLVLAGATIVSAQAKSPPLNLEYKDRTPAVVTIPPKQIDEDTAQAMSELDKQRTEKMLRESQPAPASRPDLNHDVTQGVQSQNLGGALRR